MSLHRFMISLSLSIAFLCSACGVQEGSDPEQLGPGGGKADRLHYAVATMDKEIYSTEQTTKLTISNRADFSIFLHGCSAFERQQLKDGQWEDRGPDWACLWDGYAREVKGGESYSTDPFLRMPGTFRLKIQYGIGCEPTKSLSQETCQDVYEIFTTPFVVKECPALEIMPNPEAFCPNGTIKPVLDEDGVCVLSVECVDPQPTCHVGGCSGQYCTEIPGMVSTCEWRPEYGCYHKSTCGNFGENGACGWEQTPEFVQCMASFGK